MAGLSLQAWWCSDLQQMLQMLCRLFHAVRPLAQLAANARQCRGISPGCGVNAVQQEIDHQVAVAAALTADEQHFGSEFGVKKDLALQCFSRKSEEFCARTYYPNTRAVAGLSNSKQGHLPENGSFPHVCNGSGWISILMDFDGQTALLQQQERVGHVSLFNQDGVGFRVQEFGFKLLQMGLQQIPQPVVDWCLLRQCRIHAGQATTLILISISLIQ